jgi:AraC-like DNA-binding protein
VNVGASPPSDVLRSALDGLRLDGAIFFRTEFAEDFSVSAEPNDAACFLHPGAERLILFHIVVAGRCWVTAPDGVRHVARAGDVIVVPYGDDHVVGGGEPTDAVPILSLIEPPPWTHVPVVRHGGDGPRVDIVCGYLCSDDPLFDPALAVFPRVFVVRLTGGTAAGWVQASMAYALESIPGVAPAGSVVGRRLPELVLTEVLGLHLASAPAADTGLLAALHDPVLAPALAHLHAEPSRRWTVADLAEAANVSRSVLDDRFRQVLGRSPIRYLTEWRMHLAQDLLATTSLGVVAVARRVGYESEEAFSRAFKRSTGESPGRWRNRP